MRNDDLSKCCAGQLPQKWAKSVLVVLCCLLGHNYALACDPLMLCGFKWFNCDRGSLMGFHCFLCLYWRPFNVHLLWEINISTKTLNWYSPLQLWYSLACIWAFYFLWYSLILELGHFLSRLIHLKVSNRPFLPFNAKITAAKVSVAFGMLSALWPIKIMLYLKKTAKQLEDCMLLTMLGRDWSSGEKQGFGAMKNDV